MGPEHPAPGGRRPPEATDFGLALDSRRRMKPLLDYIMETFQDGWDLLDR